MKVLVFGAEGTPAEGHEPRLRRAAAAALGPRLFRRPEELCLVFVTDSAIRRLNKRFLGHDYATDVLAFRHSVSGLPARAGAPFGDVYVAKGVARRQARELGHSWLTELATLCVHGALHLAGYDDGTEKERRRMFRRQDAIVRAHLPGEERGG